MSTRASCVTGGGAPRRSSADQLRSKSHCSAATVRNFRRHGESSQCWPSTDELQPADRRAREAIPFRRCSCPRERNAEYDRELVGLIIHIPWSAWDGFPDGAGSETGTAFEYQSKHRPGHFVIASPTAEEIDDISLSWQELLGDTVPCESRRASAAHLA